MTRTASAISAVASVLDDGRKHLAITHSDRPLNDYNPSYYTTVRNIDGSNRFMRDGGGWSFLPYELLTHPAVEAALDTLPKQSDLHVAAYRWHDSIHNGASSFA